MEKALIFNHNLPYDVNVHPVAEDTITLVPRFESEHVRDLYIDFHLQGYTDSKLGLAKWKTDLENMPARGLVYKNAKEISFNIDIVNYNEDILNRNFAVTKTESGNYKFWWIKQIQRIGQLKSTLYTVTLTLDYWWTYGIDTLFDNDKQVMIKRAHVRNYKKQIPFDKKGRYANQKFYRPLNDIWSNPFINGGEEFIPNESNYIYVEQEYLYLPFLNDDYNYESWDIFFTILGKKILNLIADIETTQPINQNDLIDLIWKNGMDLYFYWENALIDKPSSNELNLFSIKGNLNNLFPNSYLIGTPFRYKFQENRFIYLEWEGFITLHGDFIAENALVFGIANSPDYLHPPNQKLSPERNKFVIPFSLMSDSQQLSLSSTRIIFSYVWYSLTYGDLLDFSKIDVLNPPTLQKQINEWLENMFIQGKYLYNGEESKYAFINNFNGSLNPVYFGTTEPTNLSNYKAVVSIEGKSTTGLPPNNQIASSKYINNYLKFNNFFNPFWINNSLSDINFDISQSRSLEEIKIYNHPYTIYRLINSSKNQFDIMNQYVNNETGMWFNQIYVLNPGATDYIIIPGQDPSKLTNKDNFIYGKNSNYDLLMEDNTNFTWPANSSPYNDYMLQNKSRLHQNQIDKYVHASFKTAEDAAGALGAGLSGHFGAAASGAIKVAEDAYSIYQIHADYAAKMQDLKRTPGKWESKSNNLMNINSYKLENTFLFKLQLYEPIRTIVSKLFIAHGYNIGGYHKIYQFINGTHMRYFFNYLQAMNCLNIISKELSLAIKMAIQADMAQGIQIRHIRAAMLNANGSWKYMNKFNDYDVNNVEYDLAIVPT